MPWKRHLLRDAEVWAEVDPTGNLLADATGRIGVVYKRGPGAKVYRAGRGNLSPVANAPIEADVGVGAEPAPAAGASGAAARATAAKKPSRLGKTLSLGDAMPANAVHVWTDGACTGNPGPAGIGVVVIEGGKRKEHSEYLGHGTNNIAELTAVLRGVDMVTDRKLPVLVYTDSSYAIGVLSLNWKAKANVELVAEIRDTLSRLDDVRFVKVPGHAGVPENERCDELARVSITSRR